MMYYVLYGILYLFSLLPWWLLYVLSDGCYLLIYYVFRYRKQVVMSNLLIAFPEKSPAERTRIAKQFYSNFIDSFIEIIKIISMSDGDLEKRVTGNFEVLNELYATGQNTLLLGGHFFNWEYMNCAVPRKIAFPFIGVYSSISSPTFNRLMLAIRARYKTILLSTSEFQTSFHELAKYRYALALIADQSPHALKKAYWLPFFGRLTSFVPGPEKIARINNTAVVFSNFYKLRRGYYRVHFEVFTTTPRDLPSGEITRRYVDFMELSIQQNPSNYLWSHRRWKREFREEYRKQVISEVS